MPQSQSTRRRSDERAKRRAKILAAATRLIARRGLENVTFGDVAERAALSRPLVYFYFPDQRTLFLEAVLKARGSLLSSLEAAVIAVRREGASGLMQLEALVRAYAEFQERAPDAFQVSCLCDAQNGRVCDGDSLGQLVFESEQGLLGICEDVLRRGIEDGSIRMDLGRPEAVAVVLWGWIHSVVQARATRPESFNVRVGLEASEHLQLGLMMIRQAVGTCSTEAIGSPAKARFEGGQAPDDSCQDTLALPIRVWLDQQR